jgi:hypothetical protein
MKVCHKGIILIDMVIQPARVFGTLKAIFHPMFYSAAGDFAWFVSMSASRTMTAKSHGAQTAIKTAHGKQRIITFKTIHAGTP